MKLDVFQIDAFASRVFAGNPAMVCCLGEWLEDGVLRAITTEHNAAVVAFLVDRGPHFDIRYFTPIGELSLVGHASLAAAHVVLRILRPGLSQAVLHRRSGTLKVATLSDTLLAITLASLPARSCRAPVDLTAALGVPFAEVRVNDNQYFVTLEREAMVAGLAPDMDRLMKLDRDGVIVTAPGVCVNASASSGVRFWRVLPGFFFDCFGLNFKAKLGADDSCGVEVDLLVDRGHDAVFHQLGNHPRHRQPQNLRKLTHPDDFGDGDGRRCIGR